MKTIKSTSSLGRRFMDEYVFATAVSVFDAYVVPSRSKIAAYRDCLNIFFDDIASIAGSYRIISYNSFHFTFAYRCNDGSLTVITKSNIYNVL